MKLAAAEVIAPTSANVRPSWRAELRALVVIAAPLAAGFLAEMAMSVTDTIIVGRLGSIPLAGVGLAANLLFSALMVCMSVVSIVGVLAAEAHGSGQRGAISHAVRQGFWVATLLSVPAMVLGWNLAPILRWLGQEEPVIAVADAYLRGVVWCFLPYMWFTVLRNFVSALARPASIMVITIASIGLNFLAVYALVFGSFGLPTLGVMGAGIGTSIVCWVMFIALAVHVVRSPAFGGYRVLGDLLRVDMRLWREITRLGLPVAGISAVEAGLFSAVQLLMGTLGAVALAANQIAYSVMAVLFMIPAAIGQAATMRVAFGIGAGSIPAARQAGLLSIAFSAVYMAAMAALLWMMPRTTAGLFLDAGDPANAETLALAAVLLGFAAIFQVVDGIQVTAVGALRGLRDTAIPFLIGVIGYWGFGLTTGCLLAFVAGLGAVGLWAGLVVGLVITAALLTWRFHLRTQAMLRGEVGRLVPDEP